MQILIAKKKEHIKTACCPEFKKLMHLYYDKSYPFISISKLISREKEAFIKHDWSSNHMHFVFNYVLLMFILNWIPFILFYFFLICISCFSLTVDVFIICLLFLLTWLFILMMLFYLHLKDNKKLITKKAILKWFLKDHVTLKTAVMAADNIALPSQK